MSSVIIGQILQLFGQLAYVREYHQATMVQKPFKISAILLGVTVVAGTILGITTILGDNLFTGLNAYATNVNVKHAVTTSPGLTLEEVIDAFLSPAVRDVKGTQNIMIFTKSGGFIEDGQKQRNLKFDLPVTVKERKDDVSFQYFVEVKNDMTPEIAHCSDIRMHVYLDNKYQYTTGWMGYDGRSPSLPLQTDMITIEDVKKGNHDIGLKPEGRTSGCNTEGYVFSWGGTVVVYK